MFVIVCAVTVLGAPREVAAQPLQTSAESSGQIAQLLRTENNEPVAVEALEKAMVEGGILAYVTAGESLGFFGVSVTAKRDSTLFLGVSAELLFAASLRGRVASNGVEIEPGQVFTWAMGAVKPDKYRFDVARFLASTNVRLDTALAESLGILVKKQEKLVFWGVLERINLNAQATSPPPVEAVRRAYLLKPPVIRLRRGHADAAALSRAVAETFIQALAESDSTTVESLLDPQMFVPKGGGLASSDWQGLRDRFARRFTGNQWQKQLSGWKINADERADRWRIVTDSMDYILKLRAFDGMIFVSGLEPTTKAAGPNEEQIFDQATVAAFMSSQAAPVDEMPKLSEDEQARLLRLTEVGAKFRETAAFDLPKLNSRFRFDGSQILETLFGPSPETENASLWPYFFRHSLIYLGHVRAPISRIGFYNPLVDGWVITDWRHDKSDLKLIGIRVLPGEAIRGEDITGNAPIQWITQLTDRSIVLALQDALGRTATAFEQAYPLLSSGPPPAITAPINRHIDMVRDRLGSAVARLDALRANSGLKEAVDKLLAAVKSGDGPAIGDLFDDQPEVSPYQFAGLPLSFRNRLQPTGYFEIENGSLITLGAPLAGNLVMVVEYERKNKGGNPILANLGIFDLETRLE